MSRKWALLLVNILALTLLFSFNNCGSSFEPMGASQLTSTSVSGGNPSPSPSPSPVSICTGSGACPVQKIATPTFTTEIVMFEDNFLFQPSAGAQDLIYRNEGSASISRFNDRLELSGIGGLIHPALYRKATLRIPIKITSGEPEIAFAHNGLTQRSRAVNPAPGFKIVMKADSTDIVDIASNAVLASLAEAVPRNSAYVDVAVAWDIDTKSLRIDLPSSSYTMTLPNSLGEGGFAIRSSVQNSFFAVKKFSVVWQDDRRLALYDEYDQILDPADSSVIKYLPYPKFSQPNMIYQTVLVDLKKARTLIFYGNNDPVGSPTRLNILDKSTIKGFAVRDLATGDLTELPAPLNGLWPLAGGGGLDGIALTQSWNPPASLSWVDWNAFDRNDIAGFVVAASGLQATGDPLAAWVGYHDPASALDGSMIRYIKTTNQWNGETHFGVHPRLAPYASFSDQFIPAVAAPDSQTGPSGPPTELAVRDRDRAWYEIWDFTAGTNVIHKQMRGYNVFSNRDDWASTSYSVTGADFTDYANTTPSLTEPGKLWAPLVKWIPSNRYIKVASISEGVNLQYLSVGANSFVQVRAPLKSMPSPTHVCIQILWP